MRSKKPFQLRIAETPDASGEFQEETLPLESPVHPLPTAAIESAFEIGEDETGTAQRDSPAETALEIERVDRLNNPGPALARHTLPE